MALLSRTDALEEFVRVLSYRQFSLDAATRATLYADYCSRVIQVPTEDYTATWSLPTCRDADDQKFLEIARDGDAHALLSRDKALLRLTRHRLIRGRFSILTPEAWQAGQAAV